MVKQKDSNPSVAGDAILAAIKAAGKRPSDDESQATKKAYSERVSNRLAPVIAEELRKRGLSTTQPYSSAEKRGTERRIAGGLGDKKVDVTYATEHAGLVLGVSIKTISWKDRKTGNFQKNLQNRKADLVYEVTTLHKRFPYAVVGGILFLYEDAKNDNAGSKARISTYSRAHQLLKMFNNRLGTRNEDTKFEHLAIGLYRENPPQYELYEAGYPQRKIDFEAFLTRLLGLVAERNPEDFVFHDGRLYRPRELGISQSEESDEA
jgi:hypothetical protein